MQFKKKKYDASNKECLPLLRLPSLFTYEDESSNGFVQIKPQYRYSSKSL